MKEFQVFGTVTVSCYVTVEAESAEEAIEIAKSGDHAIETDDDGEPTWTRAKES